MGFTALLSPALMAGLGAAGAGISALGSYQQAKGEKAQAEQAAQQAAYNAAIARQNAALAEQEGRDAKQTGWENAARVRQQAGQFIGDQRAAAAASGVQADVGSARDLTLDTAEKGALDAWTERQKGLDVDYGKRTEAFNYRSKASALDGEADAYRSQAKSINPMFSAVSSLLGGLSGVGQNYYSMTKGARVGGGSGAFTPKTRRKN